MKPMDPIPRAAFLKLVNRSKASFNIHRSRGEMMLWCEPPPRHSGNREMTCVAYDAALFLTGFGFVSQGPSWEAIALTLPGLQYTLRDGIDRKGTFAGITLLSKTEFLVGAGTFDELHKEGVIGLPAHTWIMPLEPIVALLRKRAAEDKIALPAKLAPPPGDVPVWARGNPAWPDPAYRGGTRVLWEPTGELTVACLHSCKAA